MRWRKIWGNLLTFDSEYEPFFQPPGWIIGPIWMILYTLMAISFTITLSKRDDLQNFTLIIIFFISQLLLNIFWPSVFNSSEYLLSLIMIIFMIIFSILYSFMIYEIAPSASILFWPYIAWITFAAFINVAYYLNSL